MIPLPLLAFLRSPLARYLGIALAVVLGLALVRHLGYAAGKRDQVAAYAEAEKKAKANIGRHEAVAAQITVQYGHELAAEKVVIQTRTVTQIREVPVYVTPEADARCVVPVGFVSLFNAGVEGREAEAPRPPGGPGDAPSGVALSTVLSTTLEDFGTAYEWRAEALKWRAWYAAEKAAWDKP